ncbi:MAG: hypothetical protein GOV02_02110 [Candidatus Aenigmarchaeota archaeon]|nr:hypothetical protein [Candidatus Aenigmarchaeota archaeon]
MKGLNPLVATVLIIAISLAAISLTFQVGNPIVDRSEEILLFQDAKNNLQTIDTAIKDVVFQGEGAKRNLRLSTFGGNYRIDDASDKIIFVMDSKSQIYSAGLSNITDGINITGSVGEITMIISYDDVDILDTAAFDGGNWNVIVSNDGYNSVSGKTELSMTVS